MNRSASAAAATASTAAPGSLGGVSMRAPPGSTGLITAGAAAAADAGSADVIQYLVADHDRIAECINDVVVRRIFAAGLDLQAALGLIGDNRGASKIYHAIDELDQVIRDIRNIIFDRSTVDHLSSPQAARPRPVAAHPVIARPGFEASPRH